MHPFTLLSLPSDSPSLGLDLVMIRANELDPTRLTILGFCIGRDPGVHGHDQFGMFLIDEMLDRVEVEAVPFFEPIRNVMDEVLKSNRAEEPDPAVDPPVIEPSVATTVSVGSMVMSSTAEIGTVTVTGVVPSEFADNVIV